MKNILINSNKNNKLLLNNSKYLHSNLYKILKNKKLLEAFNKDLQTNLTKLEKNKNLLNEKAISCFTVFSISFILTVRKHLFFRN